MADKQPRKLSGKQELFCREYVKCNNASEAGRRAGYSPKTAHQMGKENILKPAIIERIKKLKAPKIKQLDLSADLILSELKKLATSNMQDFFDKDGYLKGIHDLTRDQAAALSSLEIEQLYMNQGKEKLHIGEAKKMKLWDKLKALNMLGQHLALFNEQPKGDEDDGEPDERFM